MVRGQPSRETRTTALARTGGRSTQPTTPPSFVWLTTTRRVRTWPSATSTTAAAKHSRLSLARRRLLWTRPPLLRPRFRRSRAPWLTQPVRQLQSRMLSGTLKSLDTASGHNTGSAHPRAWSVAVILDSASLRLLMFWKSCVLAHAIRFVLQAKIEASLCLNCLDQCRAL